jgi:hypothetical protein
MDRPVIFKCPNTLLNVQHMLKDAKGIEGIYNAVLCPACAKVHLINSVTGKLISEPTPDSPKKNPPG